MPKKETTKVKKAVAKKATVKSQPIISASKIKNQPSADQPKAGKLKKSEKQGRAKKYRQALELITQDKEYTIEEALDLISTMKLTKFDSSVETHIRLNVDMAKSDQQARGIVGLPHGSGKTKKIVVVTAADKEKAAKDAGADLVGGADIIQKIQQGFLDFDVLIASPDMMPEVGKIAKILGPKGLMPNPKSGTVTPDPAKAVTEIKKGQIEFRADKTGIIHQIIGKVSMPTNNLKENFETLFKAIQDAKPQAVKGNYIVSIFLCQTMGPSVKVSAKGGSVSG